MTNPPSNDYTSAANLRTHDRRKRVLSHLSYAFKYNDEDAPRRAIQLFTSWTPTVGYTFQSHHTLADGSGAATIMRASIVLVDESIGIANEGFAFWDSVS